MDFLMESVFFTQADYFRIARDSPSIGSKRQWSFQFPVPGL